jgi:hypothetical protein
MANHKQEGACKIGAGTRAGIAPMKVAGVIGEAL